MKIIPMPKHREPRVREIYAICHPGWPERPEHWYFVYPTLVAVEGVAVLGFTSFSISTTSGLVIEQGVDLCVLPEARGLKLGAELHGARVALGRAVGATMFSGCTQPDNVPMQRIFVAHGLHHCQTVARAFPDGRDGWAYIGPIGDK